MNCFQCSYFTISICIFETFGKINYDIGKGFPKRKKFRTKFSGIVYVEWMLSLDVLECKQSLLYECIHKFYKLPGGTITRERHEF